MSEKVKAEKVETELVEVKENTSKWLAEPDKSPKLARAIYRKRSILVCLLAGVCLVMCGLVVAQFGMLRRTMGTVGADARLFEYNGKNITFLDGNGVQVYPLTFDGEVYLPMTTIVDVFGMEVNTDKSVDKVIFERKFNGTENISKVARNMERSTSQYFITESSNGDTVKFGKDYSGKKYELNIEHNALALEYSKANGKRPDDTTQRLEFDVRDWDWCQFNVASDGDNAAKVYVDGREVTSILMKDGDNRKGTVVTFTGASKICFGMAVEETSKYTGEGTVIVYDVKVGKSDWLEG